MKTHENHSRPGNSPKLHPRFFIAKTIDFEAISDVFCCRQGYSPLERPRIRVSAQAPDSTSLGPVPNSFLPQAPDSVILCFVPNSFLPQAPDYYIVQCAIKC